MTAVVTSFGLGQAFFRGPGALLSTTRARPGLLRDPNQVRGLLVAYDTFHASLTAGDLARVRSDGLLAIAHDELLKQLRLLESGKAIPRDVRQEVEFLVRQLRKIRPRDFNAAVARAKHTGLKLFADFDREGVREILEGRRPAHSREFAELMRRPIGQFAPSDRIAERLQTLGIRTVGGLVRWTEEGLLTGGVSRADLIRIKQFLVPFDLRLAPDRNALSEGGELM